MSSIPFWDDDPRAWTYVTISGKQFPGIVAITGSKGRKVDVQAAKGEDGGTLVDNGYDPAKGSISLQLSNRFEWEDWQIAFPGLDPAKKERLPVEVQHPALLAIGIQRIYITTIGVPTLDAGILSLTMDWVQWFPSPKKTKGAAKKKTGDLITGVGKTRTGTTTVSPPSMMSIDPGASFPP